MTISLPYLPPLTLILDIFLTRPDFEFVRRGERFIYNDRLTILVYQILSIPGRKINQSQIIDQMKGLWIVEIIGITTQEKTLEMAAEIKAFSNYLSGFDPLFLQSAEEEKSEFEIKINPLDW